MSHFAGPATSGAHIEEIMIRIFDRYQILNDLGVSITQTSDVVLKQLIDQLQEVSLQFLKYPE